VRLDVQMQKFDRVICRAYL